MEYQTVIGLEIHAELATATKIFCSCKNSFGGGENENCCPTCSGFPGTLPVLNKEVIRLAIAAGLSFGCEIAELTKWDRKNYFYPDNPKAYQISQLYAPLCIGGGLEIGEWFWSGGEVGETGRFIRLNRIHVEEDAGKLIHTKGGTRVDLNRCGVPLIEIVTEPDLRSAEEAVEFVEKVRQTLVYAGVSDGKMEEGSLRADANISVMPVGSTKYGVRTEVKNLNSFKFIKSAIEFEVKRHIEVLESGGTLYQETRRFDEVSGETFSMRSKEQANDYRYFPDPDILPLRVSREEVEAIRKTLPETPSARRARYREYGVSQKGANDILANKVVSDFYDEVVALGADKIQAENAVRGEVLRCFKAQDDRDTLPIKPSDLVTLLAYAESGKISKNSLKTAISLLFSSDKPVDVLLEENNLLVKEDTGKVLEVAKSVIEANEKAVAQFKSGDEKVLSFLIGQCARVLRGEATPQSIKDTLLSLLKN